MILAPNHRQLLNGSKLFSFLLLYLICVSCSTQKLISTPTQISTPDVVEEVPDEKVEIEDVEWEVVSEEEVPPITTISNEGPAKEKKSSYNIAMLLPLDANKATSQTDVMREGSLPNTFVSFYTGAQLALDRLEREGLSLNVDVFDTQRSADKVRSDLERMKYQDLDIIIGPRTKPCLTEAAQFAKENEVSLISPWFGNKVTEENQYFVQLRPSLNDHYSTLLRDAAENFEPHEILLIGRDQSKDARMKSRDISRINLLQKLYKDIIGDMSAADLRVFRVSPDSLMVGDTSYDEIFLEEGRKALIFPYWSSSDEDFLYNALRRVNAEKGLTDVNIYAMPKAYDSEKIGFNHYRNLKMKVCVSKFVDRSFDEVKQFELDYFTKFGTIPDDNAFEGYDVMLFVGESLKNHGTHFQHHLTDPVTYLQSSYQIEKLPITQNGVVDDRLNEFNYFVNKHLDIIEFKNNKFTRN